ncbi:NgrE [Xenorhabdus beddingii]|uniref:NgrE n=1 Tax=Xenorhabdus beddingii TaxID=40578 RepID=A0A1Y2SRK8_9GAMM|nr:hypothetical protein [Xenorhabdus beddingii]OTA20462.1 NgrE [Xenorhabdus beddingii]
MYYSQGTINTVSGSAIVRGTGTRFKDNINGIAPGQIILIQSGNSNLLHMIQAVNSDTELVLADNAAVTLNNVSYQIQITLPDSVSDGVRHMVAINSHIINFLQNMDRWMSENGVVNVTLPNGQKVSLQSIKAMNEQIAGLTQSVDNRLEKSRNGADIPNRQEFVKNLGLVKTVEQAENALPKAGGVIDGGLIVEADFWVKRTGSNDRRLVISTSRENHALISYNHGKNWFELQLYNTGNLHYSGQPVLILNRNCYRDNSGYIRQSSPIIQIHPDGTFTTNDESEGATVTKLGLGHYRITGVLGYNSDGAWGVHGGISVPLDVNGNELVYVEDKVLPDGAIEIKVTHRQNIHMPARLQNRRMKCTKEQIYYADDEPCDLPAGTRLDVRVQMPEDSVWNLRQKTE